MINLESKVLKCDDCGTEIRPGECYWSDIVDDVDGTVELIFCDKHGYNFTLEDKTCE